MGYVILKLVLFDKVVIILKISKNNKLIRQYDKSRI